MADPILIEGQAAAIRIENLDTDQIMPKQFLHGIDKSGLAEGVLYDLRFSPDGQAKPEFVLNRPDYAKTRILVAGANFGCGSSREHAVWGLQQYGIQAVIASSFAEIFYSNAMNNRLLLVMLPEEQVAALMKDAEDPASSGVSIDVSAMRVKSASVDASFTLSPRHRRMFLEGLDVIGLSLTYRDEIEAFAKRHWAQHAWMKDVARTARDRLTWGQVKAASPGAGTGTAAADC
jgi:3-isopropylmalate/(R)-2-methylmalate dehydratase small subunit